MASSRSRIRGVETVGAALAPTAAYAMANEAYLRADFATALACLELDALAEGQNRFRSALLRYRIARIHSDSATMYDQALLAVQEAQSDGERLTGEVLLVVAESRLGRRTEIRQIVARVESALETADAECVEAGYIYAAECWRERKYGLADSIARRFIAAGSESSLLRQLLGWIAIKREAYGDAGRHFTAALRVAQSESPSNLRDVAIALHGIALVACDTVDMKLCRLAIHEYEKIELPSDLWYEEFNILLCLRFCRVLEGDSASAYRDVRRAAVIANRPTYRIMGELLGAALSQRFGDRRAFELQIAQASHLIDSTVWSDASSEERMALSEFALIAASTRPVEARKVLMRLQSMRAKEDASSSLDSDRRSIAYEQWARARVLEVSGDRSGAVDGYRKSYDTWMDLGYILRAAFVGHDLYRLTNDARWNAAYSDVLAKAPKADFADLTISARKRD